MLGGKRGQKSPVRTFLTSWGCEEKSSQPFFLYELIYSVVEVLETVDMPDETWKGNVGVITTLLPKAELDPGNTYVAMVGPPIMYRFVIAECRKKGIASDQIFVSLERKMKCGLGKCGHCQINELNACIDGPVFCYTDIEAYQEAI